MEQMALLKNQDDQSISYFNNSQRLICKFQFLFPTMQTELWIIPYLTGLLPKEFRNLRKVTNCIAHT